MHACTLEIRRTKTKHTHTRYPRTQWLAFLHFLPAVCRKRTPSLLDLEMVSVIIHYKLTPSLRLDSTFFVVMQTTGTLISVRSYFLNTLIDILLEAACLWNHYLVKR